MSITLKVELKVNSYGNDVRQLESKHRREASTQRFADELAKIIQRRYESNS